MDEGRTERVPSSIFRLYIKGYGIIYIGRKRNLIININIKIGDN